MSIFIVEYYPEAR